MKNFINDDIYLPLLNSFCNNTIGCYNCGYDQGPFIPYTMSDYKDAEIKIMYIGKNTNYWVDKSCLIDAYTNNNLTDYLTKNAEVIDVNKMLEWKNSAGAFWPTVVKLHLQIRTGRYYHDITTLGKKEMQYLGEIGYGNLYSIEIPDILKKNDKWDAIVDKDKYHIICKQAKPFEKLSNILDAYDPDLVIVFSWIDKDDFFEGLDFQCIDKYYDDGFRSVFASNTCKTKVLWTLNPRRFSFERTNTKNMCSYLSETVNKLGMLHTHTHF